MRKKIEMRRTKREQEVRVAKLKAYGGESELPPARVRE